MQFNVFQMINCWTAIENIVLDKPGDQPKPTKTGQNTLVSNNWPETTPQIQRRHQLTRVLVPKQNTDAN